MANGQLEQVDGVMKEIQWRLESLHRSPATPLDLSQLNRLFAGLRPTGKPELDQVIGKVVTEGRGLLGVLEMVTRGGTLDPGTARLTDEAEGRADYLYRLTDEYQRRRGSMG